MDEYINNPNIHILMEKFSFLGCDEFVRFDEKIYRKICRAKRSIVEKYLRKKYKKLKQKKIITDIEIFKYNDKKELEVLDGHLYNGDYNCKIKLYSEHTILEIIDLDILFTNIEKIEHRYHPIITIITDIIKHKETTCHAVLLLFDKYTKTVHLLDSNNTYSEHHQITDILQRVFDLYKYDYIPSNITNYMKVINTYNQAINQKKFFRGYCMAYSVLLAELFLSSDEEIDVITNHLTELSDYDRNELINRYHCYLFKMLYVKFYNQKIDLPNDCYECEDYNNDW